MISGCIGRKLEQVVVLRSKRSNTGFELDDLYAENGGTANSTNPPNIKTDKKDTFCLLTKGICRGCQSSVCGVQSYDQTGLAV